MAAIACDELSLRHVFRAFDAAIACRAAMHFVLFTRLQPPEVRDLKSWLKMYGEPSPDKIPTGFLTTFRASKKVMIVVVVVVVVVNVP